jgi:amino-acid N-acetyltransferase
MIQIINNEVGLEKLKKFLQENNLPNSDITLNGNIFLGKFNEMGDLIASGGLEIYDNVALLRSVAVAESQRGKSIGKIITSNLVSTAKSLNIKSIYLLTTAAHGYFIKKGFRDISRTMVPKSIQSSTEFSKMCPTTAICMVLTID